MDQQLGQENLALVSERWLFIYYLIYSLVIYLWDKGEARGGGGGGGGDVYQ